MGISRVEGGSNEKNQWGKHGCFLEFVIDLEKRFKCDVSWEQNY